MCFSHLWNYPKAMHVRKGMSSRCEKSLRESKKVFATIFNEPKSSELLSNALATMEMHDVHLLNWGSTRMAGFLDACVQASKIMVPFLDTIVSNDMRLTRQSMLQILKVSV